MKESSMHGDADRKASPDALPSRSEIVAVVLGVISGVIFSINVFVAVSHWLIVVASYSLLIGVVVAAGRAYRDARRKGRSVPRALLSTVTAPVRFIFRHSA